MTHPTSATLAACVGLWLFGAVPAVAQQTGRRELTSDPAVAAWADRVAVRIARAVRYPAAMRGLGEPRQVIVRVHVDASGRMGASDIEASSGFAVLDRAALTAVRSVRRLPPPPLPPGTGGTTVRAPIRFDPGGSSGTVILPRR